MAQLRIVTKETADSCRRRFIWFL